ncbi:MAG TPA: Ig-like domain-containing protein, partial [Dehalococcoidia bacterium]|nr:Ig-like domain-containing protein [Dehalococcoidia bacterium]
MSVRRSTAQVALCLMVIAMLLPTLVGCGGAETGADLEVWWYGPTEGSDIYGIVRLRADASADEGVAAVEFYYDSVDDEHLIGAVDTPSGSLYTQAWYTTDVENGEHTLYAVVVDEKDNSAQASRTVTVGNLTRDEAIADLVTWPKWTIQMDT